MVELLKTALAFGHKEKDVLFDSWFSNWDIKALGLEAIVMVKSNSERCYFFNSESMDWPTARGSVAVSGIFCP